jgi:hypothetical protein
LASVCSSPPCPRSKLSAWSFGVPSFRDPIAIAHQRARGELSDEQNERRDDTTRGGKTPRPDQTGRPEPPTTHTPRRRSDQTRQAEAEPHAACPTQSRLAASAGRHHISCRTMTRARADIGQATSMAVVTGALLVLCLTALLLPLVVRAAAASSMSTPSPPAALARQRLPAASNSRHVRNTHTLVDSRSARARRSVVQDASVRACDLARPCSDVPRSICSLSSCRVCIIVGDCDRCRRDRDASMGRAEPGLHRGEDTTSRRERSRILHPSGQFAHRTAGT